MTDTIGLMRLAAFRYALGRRSYMTGVIAAEIGDRAFDMSAKDRLDYINAVLETDVAGLGDRSDAIEWLDMAKALDVYYEHVGALSTKYDEVHTHHDDKRA